MAILRHFDKAIFLLLLGFTVWLGVANVRGMTHRAEEKVAVIERAETLAETVKDIHVPPPPKDADRFIGRLRSQWADIPWVVSLDSLHFYPGAERAD